MVKKFTDWGENNKMGKRFGGDFKINDGKPRQQEEITWDMKVALSRLNQAACGRRNNYLTPTEIKLKLSTLHPGLTIHEEELTEMLNQSADKGYVDIQRRHGRFDKYSITATGQTALGLGDNSTYTPLKKTYKQGNYYRGPIGR